MARPLVILGSCVSRDLLDIAGRADLALTEYRARSSWISLVSTPESTPDLSGLKSAFQRRMVESDFSKSFWTSRALCEAEILLVDLIDERFDVLQTERGFVTLSPELQSSGHPIVTRGQRLHARTAEKLAQWTLSAEAFAQGLEELGLDRKLVVNEVFWARTTAANVGLPEPFDQERVGAANAELRFMYTWLRLRLPCARFITYDRELFVADPAHRWGLSPYHYNEELYHHALKSLVQILARSAT